ncbi:uncharacterized protein LOC119079957 [Bradysia coprophila]|uniref:uncharacterized protein LOC119079957 n=1 Tax=Bradysia coprophila TaxID=38358 RepID=UPI00187DC885|nr:uncharacterized protein LOC119079957 [Bradysia coprophila]
MALLLENYYSHDFFKTIPELGSAIDNFVERKIYLLIDQLGPIFHKHGVNRDYGLILCHRHFDIEHNEILVEVLKKDHRVSVATPWKLNGGKVIPSEDETLDVVREDADVPYVIPQTWGFDDNAELKAYEFLASRMELGTQKPPPEFVAELYEKLKQLGCEKIFGLRFIGNMIGRVSCEITPKGKRASILSFDGKDMDKTKMFQVVFMFCKEDGMGLCEDCSSSCTGDTVCIKRY